MLQTANKLAILDTDEVLVAVLPQIDKFMIEQYGPSLGIGQELLTVVPGYYNLDTRYPWVAPGTSIEYITAFAEYGGYKETEFLPGVEKAVEMLFNDGWRIEVVSSLDPAWLEDRYSVLRHLDIRREQIHLTGLQKSKTAKLKSLIEDFQPRQAIFVDDLPGHLNAARGIVNCVMIERNYLDQVSPGAHVEIHDSLLSYTCKLVS